MTLDLLRERLSGEKARDLFSKLYGQDPQIVEKQVHRYIQATVRFANCFPGMTNWNYMFSALRDVLRLEVIIPTIMQEGYWQPVSAWMLLQW